MSVENWSGSMKDKLIKSAVTAGSFMVIDKLYYKSPLGMEWKKGGISFVASYLSEIGSDMIAPKLGSSVYMVEKTYLQPVSGQSFNKSLSLLCRYLVHALNLLNSSP